MSRDSIKRHSNAICIISIKNFILSNYAYLFGYFSTNNSNELQFKKKNKVNALAKEKAPLSKHDQIKMLFVLFPDVQ